MYFLSTFLSVAVLLALLVPGFVLRKIKLVSDTAAKDLSAVLIYIGTPAMIFYCMMTVDVALVTPARLAVCVGLSLFIHLVAFAAVKLAFRKNADAGRLAAASFSLIFSNCGFIGIPVTQIAITFCDAFAGDESAALSEAMLYVTVFNVVFNLLNWTLGVFLYGGAEKKRVMVRRALLNPCSIATLVALPFTLTGFSLLRPIVIGGFEMTQVASLITYLYNICVPVSMCILGIRLADTRPAAVVKDPYVYAACAIKLLAVPAAALGIMLLLNIWLDVGGPLIMAMTVMAAAPSATTALAFAERFNGACEVAGGCIVATTVLSVLTVPLFLSAAAAFL